jgi:hypothetical protein
MAIARGAGTEIIRAHHFEGIAATEQAMIIGEQHHIYTVLSMIISANTATANDLVYVNLTGYDATAGDSAQTNIRVMKWVIPAEGDVFIWNDKFSFNGYEPVDFGSPPLSTAAEQNAIADQGGGVAQKLGISGQSSCALEVHITFIDQNNA